MRLIDDTVKRLNKLYESTTSLCASRPKLLKNVVIEPFTTIHNNVIIGDGTFGSNVT
jgi:acyl-[acyl carrier protein]--UDP-N-acetylglucosamine O-acyltransferase